MKKAYLMISIGCLLFLSNLLSAQDSGEANTLLDGNSLDTENLGYFVAPSIGFTQMDGSSAALFSLRAGLSLKDQVSVGAYFNTALNQINPESETLPDIYMDYWTVGGFAEYTLFSKRMVHLSFPVYIGFGEVQMDNEEGDAGLGEANFLQIEPSALLEVNVHRNLRLSAGAGYRVVEEMNYRNFNQSDLSGFTAYIGLKIGIFK